LFRVSNHRLGYGVRHVRVWQRLLGVEHTVIERIELVQDSGEEVMVARVRPTRSRRSRCSRCDRRCPGYDAGSGRRRWRTLDLGTVRAYLEADSPRVTCREHGVVVAAVPWARRDARFSYALEDTVAWLASHAAFTVVTELMRVTWRSVAGIVTRVVADLAGKADRLDGLRRIGIEEIAHRRGQRYLTVVVDHDSGRLVWAAPGRNSATVRGFFDALGAERAAALTHVTADGAEWIHTVVAERAPRAVLGIDPFHVVAWATQALDEVRRGVWNDLRRAGKPEQAATLKGSRWALVKNPEDLTGAQQTTLASIAATNKGLYRAYLLKEQLRAVFAAKGTKGRILLAGWLSWAKRSRLPAFVKLAKTIDKYRPLIWNTLNHQLSNARVEATNTHLRVLTRRAYGFHSPESLIAMAMLTRGGLRPALPGRAG
jgi:transposase